MEHAIYLDHNATTPVKPEAAAAMAVRARGEVENNWDMSAITRKLVNGYREMVKEKRSATSVS